MNEHLSKRLLCLASPTSAQVRRTAEFLGCLLLAQVLAGCDGVTATPPADNPPPPPASGDSPPFDGPSGHGHFRGTATIGDDLYHAEALLTVDGELRLFVGDLLSPTSGPITGAGLGELLDPEEGRQFSGVVALSGGQGGGAGVVTGELCAAPDVGRFCGESVPAEASINDAANGKLAGEIRIATTAGDETWLLDLSAWSAYYTLSAAVAHPAGTFWEELAQFAEGDDVAISVDGAGALFFQAPATGCVGNGTLTPHQDGEFYVFDVELLIENCNATYAFLNNRFIGLATETQDNYWDYDDWLVMFVSTPDGVQLPAAITMYAFWDGAGSWDY
jgi:hypothetical protein